LRYANAALKQRGNVRIDMTFALGQSVLNTFQHEFPEISILNRQEISSGSRKPTEDHEFTWQTQLGDYCSAVSNLRDMVSELLGARRSLEPQIVSRGPDVSTVDDAPASNATQDSDDPNGTQQGRGGGAPSWNELSADQISELHDLICEVVSVAELSQIARLQLGVKLEDIVAVQARSKEGIVFALIEWLEHRGRIPDLLKALVAQRPGVERVRKFCDPLLSKALSRGVSPVTKPPDANETHALIIEFGIVFAQRRDWFRYLNAYKTLHDVLHKLQDMQEAINQAVERFSREPRNAAQMQIIANTLEYDLVSDATAANQNTEFPDDHGAWVGTFAASVKQLSTALAPADLPALSEAVNTLRALPRQQTRVNQELVLCARRLRAEELVARIDGILAGVGQITDGGELRDGFTRFRALCEQLPLLITDHDACQRIQDSFFAVVELTGVTREQISGWPDVLTNLLRIAARRPADAMTARVAEYARVFDSTADSSAATDQFLLLREYFLRLFHKTDEALLRLSDKLIQEGDLLAARIKRFSSSAASS
jgi:hypothetical protein